MELTSVVLQRLSKRANTWYKLSFITFLLISDTKHILSLLQDPFAAKRVPDTYPDD